MRGTSTGLLGGIILPPSGKAEDVVFFSVLVSAVLAAEAVSGNGFGEEGFKFRSRN
jgi:hypothetical protein